MTANSPQMDFARDRQRSASYSSLHNAYGSQRAYSHHRPTYPPAHRRPLRSVNENSAFLRSPGPLESMLKTTTETGDIGIFSIGHSPATYRPPRRSRRRLADTGSLPRSHTGTYDDGFCQDDRRWLPSYRDTTSEIISLYASDTQPSRSGSFSPTMDDRQRSFSLTTCSSRHIPSHQSCATLQSQGSVGGMQRPRSPFPYPTRLKRPGVRPSSPALTENGSIDYTRMVELDRVSHRTIHGSYRSAYSTGHRQPLAVPLRPEPHSTVSLPSRVSPNFHQMGYPIYRTRTPNYSLPRTPRPSYRNRTASSTEPSLRSASLTSIVEMYHRPPTATATTTEPSLRSPGSFYYDYSEGFEEEPPPELTDEVPLCPIPQRAGTYSRPLVLRDESQLSLDVGAPEVDQDYEEYQEHDETTVHLISETQQQRQGSIAGSTLVSHDSASVCLQSIQASEKPKSPTEVLVQTRQSLQIDTQRSKATAVLLDEAHKGHYSAPAVLLNTNTSLYESASATCSPDSEQRNGIQEAHVSDKEDVSESPTEQRLSRDDTKLPTPREDSHQKDTTVPARTDHIANIVREESINLQESNHAAVLAPEPTSLGGQLKANKSIPQLMKALPPIPTEGARRSSDSLTGQPESPRETCQTQRQQKGQAYELSTATSAVVSAQRIDEDHTPPKFKVRMKLSPPNTPIQAPLSSPASQSQETTLLEKKLRLKVSRSQLKGGRATQGDSVLCASIIRACPPNVPVPISLEKIPSSNSKLGKMHIIPGDSDNSKKACMKTKNTVQEHPVDVSDQFDLHCPQSSRTVEVARNSKSSTKTLIGRESRGSDSGVEVDTHHGLRKKMSLLRVRIPRRQASASPRAVAKSSLPPTTGVLALSQQHGNCDRAVQVKGPTHEAKKRSNTIGGRVKRWASGAKRAMRLCVRRALDGPSRTNE